jgi:hypothetical protein
MTKWTLAILLLVLAVAPIAIGQNTPANPADQAAIVWTGMQQPVPEPAQDTAAKEIPPAAQQGAEQNTERSPEQREQPEVQNSGKPGQQANPASSSNSDNVRSLTGTVVKENSGYFLRTADNSEYQLDDVSKVKGFENQSVSITGTVDSSTRTIHVQNVKPGS